MSTTAESFFSKEENQAILRRFALELESVRVTDAKAPDVTGALKLFFAILIANPNIFDQHCAANIEWIGQRFIGLLVNFPSKNEEENSSDRLIVIFTMAYRFLCELDFSQPGDLSFELRSIKTFVNENLEKFVGIERQQLIYANYIMPANITKQLINNPALAEFKDFANTVKSASALKEEWEKEIKAKSEEIEVLRDGISRVSTAYNFVGLVNGFETLASMKRWERRRSFMS